MRVLVISNMYAPAVGGIEVLLRQLLPALRDQGHEVVVLTTTMEAAPEAVEVMDGLTIHRVDLLNGLAARDPLRVARGRRDVRRILEQVRPDLIHAHDVGPNLWTVLTEDPGVPVVITVHFNLGTFHLEGRGQMAQLLDRSSWVTGVSSAAVRAVLDLAPSLEPRTSVIMNGLPPSPEPSPPDMASAKIAALGRFVVHKGFDVLLQAMPLVREAVPNVSLQLVGDGPDRRELEDVVRSLDLERCVSMPGTVRHPQVADALAAASVVAVPSRAEGMPLVALEAAAAGRAVVATPVDGLADIVVDGETGIVVPPEDPVALAEALVALLLDAPRATTMGAAARRRAVEVFPLERTVEAYDALFRRLVSTPT